MTIKLSFFIAVGLGFLTFSIANGHEKMYEESSEPSCPLKFDIIRELIKESSKRPTLLDSGICCQFILESNRLVRSEYLRTHGYFAPSSMTSKACWASYEALTKELVGDFDVQSYCGYNPESISKICENVSSKSEFERLIPQPKLQQVREYCNKSLKNSSHCSMCTEKLLSLGPYFRGIENTSDCAGYPFMYAAAFVSQFGPTDLATANCLFSLHLEPRAPNRKQHIVALSGAVTGSVVGVFGAVLAVWFLTIRNKKLLGREKKISAEIESSFVTELGSIDGTNLVKYKYEEIKRATDNFSRENIIGNGKYGNVYKGILQDGSEVAVKRFKNCSIAGDGTFEHEVEVIASVRHVNLVSLRGYCTATVPLEGHQRIIVCDLMPNGSLYDHLFGSDSEVKRLSWPTRQKIALGTAHGLAYLHYGAQPTIIHRDVKASNILLDEKFEPKMADFGLAKFNPKGMTHLSTTLAGTLGYVAPEYALYGKLAEGSDVYSFGVVLLELLSGKKALLSMDEEKTCLITDWAWSLVIKGNPLDIIEENMPEVGLPELMEQYVCLAIFCCHPQLHARPTMDQIVKLLETPVLFRTLILERMSTDS